MICFYSANHMKTKHSMFSQCCIIAC